MRSLVNSFSNAVARAALESHPVALSAETVLAVLRDGRHIVGTLISYDHFGSIILQDARERHFASGSYCDIPMGGLYVVRGENVSLLGELVRRGERRWLSAPIHASPRAGRGARRCEPLARPCRVGSRATVREASLSPAMKALLPSLHHAAIVFVQAGGGGGRAGEGAGQADCRIALEHERLRGGGSHGRTLSSEDRLQQTAEGRRSVRRSLQECGAR